MLLFADLRRGATAMLCKGGDLLDSGFYEFVEFEFGSWCNLSNTFEQYFQYLQPDFEMGSCPQTPTWTENTQHSFRQTPIPPTIAGMSELNSHITENNNNQSFGPLSYEEHMRRARHLSASETTCAHNSYRSEVATRTTAPSILTDIMECISATEQTGTLQGAEGTFKLKT